MHNVNRQSLSRVDGYQPLFDKLEDRRSRRTFKRRSSTRSVSIQAGAAKKRTRGLMKDSDSVSASNFGYKDFCVGKDRIDKPSAQLPKIAHIIWLSRLSNAKVPNDRTLNILRLCSDLLSEGWHVKLWTNKRITIERAFLSVALPSYSKFRGLQLEVGADLLRHSMDKKMVEICLDQEMFSLLNSIDQTAYEKACNENDLPLLWTASQQRTRFKKTLLNFYLSCQVGHKNYASMSDYLRIIILKRYGGVYIDSDTISGTANVWTFDNLKKQPLFYPLPVGDGIILATGSDTGINNDLIAAEVNAKQINYVLMDQFYWSVMYEEMPYVFLIRGHDLWRMGTMRFTSKGFKVKLEGKKGCLPSVPSGQCDRQLVSLRDASRFPGCLHSSIKGSYPALQQGAGFDNAILPINEQNETLRYLLALHSPGPLTLTRMVEACYEKNHHVSRFKNRKKSSEKVRFDNRVVLSVTKWGGLSRMVTLSWDKSKVKASRCFDDGKVQDILVSLYRAGIS